MWGADAWGSFGWGWHSDGVVFAPPIDENLSPLFLSTTDVAGGALIGIALASGPATVTLIADASAPGSLFLTVVTEALP